MGRRCGNGIKFGFRRSQCSTAAASQSAPLIPLIKEWRDRALNKKMLLIWAVLTLALLSACGNSNDNHASGHGNHGEQTPAANNTNEDSHGGHGGAQKEASD